MARKPRVEFEGAAYHVMSRGDRGDTIFPSDDDKRLFLTTLDEACERTGWEVHAFVLMSNHYHALIRTPQANLVLGMKWLQSTYTQRINVRRREHGHLFQGRYKSIPVDAKDDGCFERMATYIHLNPIRAQLVPPGTDLETYAWSSYPYYTGKEKSPGWLHSERVMGALGMPLTQRGRQAYARYMEKRIQDWHDSNKRTAMDQEWKPIRRGWYVGSMAFKAALLDQVEKTIAGKDGGSFSGEAMHDHSERGAQALLVTGLQLLKLGEPRLPEMPKGAIEKCALAWFIKKNTTARNHWIAEHLHMGHPGSLPGYIRKFEKANDNEALRLRQWLAKAT